MPLHFAGHPLLPAASPHLPAGLWLKAATLLADCLLAACLTLALAPQLPGIATWVAAALAVTCYAIALCGVAWRPVQAEYWAVLAALLLGTSLGLATRVLSPYLPGIMIPALAAELTTFCVLWGLHYGLWPPVMGLRVTASVLTAQALVYLLAVLLAHYFGQDYLWLALGSTGLVGFLVNAGISTLLAAQVERQVQRLTLLPGPLPEARAWLAATGLLACLAGYSGKGGAGPSARQ